jgi:hypothetical protein
MWIIYYSIKMMSHNLSLLCWWTFRLYSYFFTTRTAMANIHIYLLFICKCYYSCKIDMESLAFCKRIQFRTICCILFFYLFVSVLVFELRIWTHLLGWLLTTWAMPPALLSLFIFEIGSHYEPGVAWTPSYFMLLNIAEMTGACHRVQVLDLGSHELLLGFFGPDWPGTMSLLILA